jgi:predicted amidohydrolase YtcJ
MLADLTVLDQDYFTVPDEQIKDIESSMTIGMENRFCQG